MAYTTSTEVAALTGSSLSSDTVSELITLADKEIDASLARDSLSITGSTPALIGVASLYLSSAFVLERQRGDGTLPDSVKAGDMSVLSKISEQIASYRSMAYKTLRDYTTGQLYATTAYVPFARVQQDYTDKEYTN